MQPELALLTGLAQAVQRTPGLSFRALVAAATSGETIATVAETVRGYNRAVTDAVAQVAGTIDASRQLQLATDYVGEAPNVHGVADLGR